MDYNIIKGWSITLLIILATIALGLWAVNQALEYRYRSEFLQKPCELCSEINKAQSNCVRSCFSYQYAPYTENNTGGIIYGKTD